ncbi:DUF4340 domain-containing protein [Stigmatella sp. ncwal1]|uniref:DUF4340 domain-containing protein n=1 Tax=Stigmatella ashevillensis TaxID=2995309 RepID=A0ABT5D7I6_9BACT|nr:DUF4340 domain-containing protein [Stigmatella ashevillena]MDC0709040.1 DUF4340 domain-containing protein [Stigmatella ashevillena]
MRPLPRRMGALLVLTAALAGTGLLACKKKPEDTATQHQEQIFTATPSGERSQDGGTEAPVFTNLTVQSKGTTTVLELQGATWRITAPLSARADKWTADNLIRQLQSAKFKSTVKEAPTAEDLKAYGLEPPVFSVTAQAYLPDATGGGRDEPGRQRTVTLHGGLENPFDGSLYVRREGDPRVYAADGSVRYALDKDLYALREKEFLGLEEPSLKTLSVTAKSGAYTLEKEPDKTWRFTKPSSLRADAAKIKRMLQSLREQRALAFPADSAEERSRLGLDKPLVDALFSPTTGEPVRVRISRAEAQGTAKVYALHEQGTEAILAEVPEAAATVLIPGVQELRDKTVLSFRKEDVKRLTLLVGPEAPPLTLENTASNTGPLDGWRMVSPQTGKAKTWKVASLLNLLGTLKASAMGEASPKKWASYGITSTSRGAVLLDANNRELARLSIGSEVPGQNGLVYARGSGDEVLEVEQARLAEWPSRPEDVLEGAPAAKGEDAGKESPQP